MYKNSMFLPAHISVRSLNITGNPKYTVTSQRAIYTQVTQALHVPLCNKT